MIPGSTHGSSCFALICHSLRGLKPPLCLRGPVWTPCACVCVCTHLPRGFNGSLRELLELCFRPGVETVLIPMTCSAPQRKRHSLAALFQDDFLRGTSYGLRHRQAGLLTITFNAKQRRGFVGIVFSLRWGTALHPRGSGGQRAPQTCGCLHRTPGFGDRKHLGHSSWFLIGPREEKSLRPESRRHRTAWWGRQRRAEGLGVVPHAASPPPGEGEWGESQGPQGPAT